MKNKTNLINFKRKDILSKMKVRVKTKKSEPACMMCLPPTFLKDHPTYRGMLVHSRIDCPDGHIYFMNDSEFINNWEES